MLSVKQGGIKYHFLSLWYDSIWDFIQALFSLEEVCEDEIRPEQNIKCLIYPTFHLFLSYINTHIHTHIYIYIYIYIYMYTHTHIYMYVYICMNIHIYVFIKSCGSFKRNNIIIYLFQMTGLFIKNLMKVQLL